MRELLEILNQNSDALTIIFTAVVTLSTVVYAALTWKLVSETRKMRQVQTEPKIHITLENFDFSINMVRLNIKNIGLGPANNLQFTPSVISGGESATNLLKDFTQSNYFKTGIRHFGPNQNIYSSFTRTTDDYEGKSISILSFKINYESATGKKFSEEIIIDMGEIKGRYQFGKPNLYSIAKSLENIEKDIHSLAMGSKRVKADVYSSDDRKKEREEMEQYYADFEKKNK